MSVPAVSRIFMEANEHFQQQEFYMFGKLLAEIAWVLQKPEVNTYEQLEQQIQLV